MTNEEIIKALRVCARGACADCPLPASETRCTTAFTAAADALEDLKQLADNIEKERKCLEEELHRMGDVESRLSIELACKKTENEILRGELRRMFRLYVAAEMRADAGTSTEEVDDA